ncbi:apolipoprotein A-IV-like [Phyllopteryx taeniolatus]|uniref:apolipoprotein A-IV-like n=1 Tax=Phyllopteryx taeniolatus TaxID=161469 RepID=UPI002AD4668B|nr:apolipoprotein A-IV-like [Phyllopteryx taeniolatus]XP_061631758.1 apolipoprotein A-IV-like [Phyllopteryx taeniolatus]XP_061631759.1 apolipoprotein A-IV-like [Phyllopteryx taeniolatus]XP_061631760.1 apolipoprotein A-IV-like [Phyllopteryx taeniolatus]
MRIFVLLALAVISGCNANLFHADAPMPPMEALTDAFWDYIAKASKTADDTLEMVMKSQFGAEVNAHLAETADVASRYASTLKEKLPLAAQDLMAKISAEADVLMNVVSQDLSSVGKKVEQYSNTLKSQIQERVEQLKRELNAYADNVDSDALKATIVQSSQELMAGLQLSIMDLESKLGPYTADLKRHVDEHLMAFQRNIGPMTYRFQDELSFRSREVQRLVAPYAEDLKERLDHFTTDLQQQLRAQYDSLVN